MTGFTCPKCGCPTEVTETRHNVSGLRRRRRCVIGWCNGKLTTQEIIVTGGANKFDGSHMIVPRVLVDRMAALSADLAKLRVGPVRDGWPEDEVAW